jgi:MFS family permease
MTRPLTRMIRVLLLFESAMYSAVTPVLPHYQHALHASKPALGLLVAGYPAGLLPGSLLGGWLAARVGVRRTTLAGLIGFGLAIAGFGLVTVLPALDALRLVQGLFCGLIWGGGLTWVIAAEAPERRGAAIGGAIGAATLGTLIGPVLGTVAVTAGTGVTFGATGLIAFGLVAWTARHPDPEHAPVPGAILGQLRDALRAGGFGLGFWLVTLEAMTFGATGVLIPLRLSHLGAPGWEIGGVFVAASALSTVLSPLVGRVVDRRGAPITLAVGLATAAPLIAALALPGSATELAVLAVIALGIPLTAGMIPSLALMTGATERAAVSLILATTAVNFAFALGEVIGAPSAAAISQATGDWVPLVGIAALMVASLGLLRRAKDAVAGDNRPRGALHTARGATTPDPEHRPRRRNRRRADLPDRPSPVRVGTAPPALCGDAAGAEPRPGGAAERP